MKIISKFEVQCSKCDGIANSFTTEFTAIDWLFEHIRNQHPGTFQKLQIEGRQMATSQNGCGYFDNPQDKSKNSGWYKSREGFKLAWTKHALKIMLDK